VTGDPIPPEEFAAAVRGLDAERFASFVGALRAGTAEEVRVDPPVVTVGSEPTTRLLAVAADGAVPDDADADAVVLADGDPSEWDLPAVGPDALRRRLLYALPADEADAVAERCLGRPARSAGPDTDDGHPSPDGREAGFPGGILGGLAGRVGREGVAVVALVVLLVAGGAVALVGGGSGPDESETVEPISPDVVVPEDDRRSVAANGSDTPAAGTPLPAERPLPSGNASPETDLNGSDFDSDRYAGLEPTCNRSYLHVVQIQMNALRFNDNETNDGIRTVRRFASPQNREGVSYSELVRVVNSRSYDAMLTYDSVEYLPERTGEDSARVRVVTRENEVVTGRFLFRLSRQEGGEYDGCWMTDGVLASNAYPF